MSKYAAISSVEINGKTEKSIKSVSEGEIAMALRVKLMGGSGAASLTPEESCVVNYVRPIVGAIDWRKLDDFTVTIRYEGGLRVTYSGCSVETIGERLTDGEDVGAIPIAIIATGDTPRIEEQV